MKNFSEFVKEKESMIVATINWKKVETSEPKELSNKYDLYLFYRGKNTLYIGKSFEQQVLVEINKTIKRLEENYQFNKIGVGVFVGMLNLDKSDAQRRSNQLITDIECLLIYNQKPTYNTQCQQNYTGRKKLQIINKNCDLLSSRIKYEN